LPIEFQHVSPEEGRIIEFASWLSMTVTADFQSGTIMFWSENFELHPNRE
jgi:hypothetical protein